MILEAVESASGEPPCKGIIDQIIFRSFQEIISFLFRHQPQLDLFLFLWGRLPEQVFSQERLVLGDYLSVPHSVILVSQLHLYMIAPCVLFHDFSSLH